MLTKKMSPAVLSKDSAAGDLLLLLFCFEFVLCSVGFDDIRVFKLTDKALLETFDIFTAKHCLFCLFFFRQTDAFLLFRKFVYAVYFFLCQRISLLFKTM